MRYLNIFIVILFFWNSSYYYGQTSDNKTRFISFPQDTSLTSIPNNLQIWKPEDLWEKISLLGLNYKKDEFETKAEYNERIKVMIKDTKNRMIADNVSVNDLLAVDCNTFSWDTYEPELGTIRIKMERFGITMGPMDLDEPNIVSDFDCLDSLRDFDYSLIFSQDYKTKVVFPYDNMSKFGLAGQSSICGDCVYMRVPVKREIAKSARSMHGLAIIKLLQPFYTTTKNPQSIGREYQIYANLVELWFFDPVSKDIFAKIKPFTYREHGGVF